MLSNATSKTWLQGRTWGWILICAGAAMLSLSSAVSAATPQGVDATLAQQWVDLLHYINIARPELAASFGKAVLEKGAAKELYLLSVEYPDSLPTLQKGAKLKGMKKIVASLRKKIEDGYEDWRRDPKQIEESIALLGKGLRAYEIARQRLQRSGEHAIPLLIQTLTDSQTPKLLQERIVTMLEDLGRSAVRPYSEALQAKDLRLVGFLANALGRIEYPAALPYLREALLRSDLQDPNHETRKQILAAMIACAGGDASVVEKSPAELFYQLAEEYYQRAESLRPENEQNAEAFVWYWKEGTGLIPRPVPAEILCDVYAMRTARQALRYDPSFSPAVPLWLSAALRREIDLPKGKTDPLWGQDRPRAAFYTLASSPRYLQAVLARALHDGNTAIASRVIAAMGRTTGAASLVAPLSDGAMPLVSALGYPDKNLRFLAAETLMLAMPTEEFFGYETVVNLMSDALREEGKKYALVVVQDAAARNDIVDAVRGAGFEVLKPSDPARLTAAAQQEAGLDLVYVGPKTPARTVVETFRKQAMYSYLPIVIQQTGPMLRELARKDGRIVLLEDAAVDAAKVSEAVRKALALSAGKPLTKEQATDWAIRAARAIQVVGQRDNVIHDIRRATPALREALKREDPAVRIAVADALAVVDAAEAQQAVVNLAMTDSDEKVRVAAFQAASRSVRRFGNRCDDAQAKSLVDLVTAGKGSQILLEAAAQLLGAMNLPSEKTPALIESTAAID